LTGGFRRRISKQTPGGRIPAGDGAVERRRDDGIAGRFDRRAEQALTLGMMVARLGWATANAFSFPASTCGASVAATLNISVMRPASRSLTA